MPPYPLLTPALTMSTLANSIGCETAIAPLMVMASTTRSSLPITRGAKPNPNRAFLATSAGMPRVANLVPALLINSMYDGCDEPGSTMCLKFCRFTKGLNKADATGLASMPS